MSYRLARQVLQPATWWSPNAQSQKKSYADLHLLRQAHAADDWNMVDDAWKAHLLPQHHFIVNERTKEMLYVLQTFDTAALCWPAKVVGRDLTWNTDVTSLRWTTCTSATQFKIQPVVPMSPLHKRLKKHSVDNLGISFLAVGKLKSLEKHAVDTAFAGIPEGILRKMLVEEGWSEEAMGDESHVVLELIRAKEPDLSETEALELLHKRTLQMHRVDEGWDDMGDDELHELLIQGDFTTVKTQLGDNEKMKASCVLPLLLHLCRATISAQVQFGLPAFSIQHLSICCISAFEHSAFQHLSICCISAFVSAFQHAAPVHLLRAAPVMAINCKVFVVVCHSGAPPEGQGADRCSRLQALPGEAHEHQGKVEGPSEHRGEAHEELQCRAELPRVLRLHPLLGAEACEDPHGPEGRPVPLRIPGYAKQVHQLDHARPQGGSQGDSDHAVGMAF
jgi:hypothetical protein